jgi:hypothetical protein
MKPGLIAVRLDGVHAGLIVLHTPEEYEKLWRGVDKEAATKLGKSS